MKLVKFTGQKTIQFAELLLNYKLVVNSNDMEIKIVEVVLLSSGWQHP
jgi:hypothetical protein